MYGFSEEKPKDLYFQFRERGYCGSIDLYSRECNSQSTLWDWWLSDLDELRHSTMMEF